MKAAVVALALVPAGVVAAEPVATPWQLHAVAPVDAVEADTAIAAARDPHGNVDLAEPTVVSASYQVARGWAATLRLGVVANDAPGAALDGVAVGNPIVGVTSTTGTARWRFAGFAAAALPIGGAPDARAAKAAAAAITARPADEAMFALDSATAIAGADVAYVRHGITAQAEASLAPSVRVHGTATDALRARAAVGAHVGVFLGAHVSLGVDLAYRRWLAHPTTIDEMTGARVPLAELATLTAAIGARVHVRLGAVTVHPGLSYTRGFDGVALHGPTTVTHQTNTIGLSIPVTF